MKEIINSIESLKRWHDNLDEESKNNISIYCMVGNIEEGCNVDLITGSEKSLVISLANSMVNDRDYYDIAKKAISLVDAHYAQTLKEESQKLGVANTKYCS